MKNKEYVDFDKQKKYILNMLDFFDYKLVPFNDRIKGCRSWIMACDILYEYKVVCELEKLSNGKMDQESFDNFMERID